MRRISAQPPYQVVISARAWSGLGAVGSERFHAVQRWLDEEAQALGQQQEPGAEKTRGTREVAGLWLTFEVDPAARRLALLSAIRA